MLGWQRVIIYSGFLYDGLARRNRLRPGYTFNVSLDAPSFFPLSGPFHLPSFLSLSLCSSSSSRSNELSLAHGFSPLVDFIYHRALTSLEHPRQSAHVTIPDVQFLFFLTQHLWNYDRFNCLKWNSGRQPGAFKRVMTVSFPPSS